MGVVKRISKKKFDLTKMAKAAELLEETKMNYYLDRYKLAQDILEAGEYYGVVKDISSSDERDFVRIQPYTIEEGKSVHYEDVFINLKEVNSMSSAAGQFITLFRKARHWGDIRERVVGIEIKLVEGDTGKIFKNVTRVFETAVDELIFDDEHMYDYVKEAGRKLTEDSEEEIHNKPSKVVDDILYDDDDDDEYEDYEEEE